MRISEIVSNCNKNFGIYKVIEDVEFDYLGLCSSNLDFSFCTFIDNEDYVTSISKNI